MTTWEELAAKHPENQQLQMIVAERAGKYSNLPIYRSTPDGKTVIIEPGASDYWGKTLGQTQTGGTSSATTQTETLVRHRQAHKRRQISLTQFQCQLRRHTRLGR